MQQEIDGLFWWHSLDLNGHVTPGKKTPEWLAAEVEAFHFPDLTGKRVLDIGAWDGFYSYWMEAHGAAEVTALDHFVWSLDFRDAGRYHEECLAKGVTPQSYELTPLWRPHDLPGKRGFDLAHRVLKSRVRSVVGDFMAIDLQPLGQFDVVLYSGVIYHQPNPFECLQRVRSVTKDVAIIETAAIIVPGFAHVGLWQCYSPLGLNADPTNWWAPNQKGLELLCLRAGFRKIDVVKSEPWRPPMTRLRAGADVFLTESTLAKKLNLDPPAEPQVYRLIAHAWV